MYEEFYKLKSRPFQLSPDIKYFFGSREHRRALAYLQYGITQEEGFIVITGEIGTGKTTLVQAMFNELETDNLVTAQLVTTQLEGDELLHMVASAFGIDCHGLSKAGVLQKINEFLHECSRQGKRALLVVDEVQNMPFRSLEELRMLSNYQIGGKALLQTFLIGQHQFLDTLYSKDMEQLYQRVIAAHHLKPLAEDEIQGYIECRLKQAGWKGEPVFEDDAYRGIFQYTNGVPRRVNVFCDRLLLYGYLEGLDKFGAAAVKSVSDEFIDEISHHHIRQEKEPGQDILDQRLAVLEERIIKLEDTFQMERIRLRRAISQLKKSEK